MGGFILVQVLVVALQHQASVLVTDAALKKEYGIGCFRG